MRQSGNHLVWLRGQAGWLRLDLLPLTRNIPRMVLSPLLTQENVYPTTLCCTLKRDMRVPSFWQLTFTHLCRPLLCIASACKLRRCLVTSKETALTCTTHLRPADCLDHLPLATCLLHVWCMALGVHVIESGLAPIVDRRERCELTLFRLGFNFLRHILPLRRSLVALLFSVG